MAFIAPLKGVRFNQAKVGKLDEVVTPPYDVISQNAEDMYAAKTEYSMIRLDITKTPGTAVEKQSRYQDAANLFHSWLDQGVLVRDSRAGIYLYETEYLHPSGKRLNRKGLVCLVGLAEFNEGIVKPHEKTFDTVIQDRLKLVKECKAQFSQVFSLFSDKENEVIATLEANHDSEPLASITDADGCVHTIWRITNDSALQEVKEFFLDRSLYIADGHHRYTTALAYKKYRSQLEGKIDDTDPANHIIMYLCPMEDPGLSVLPTHRLVYYPGIISSGQLIDDTLSQGFQINEIEHGSRETLIEEVLSLMDEAESQVIEERATTFGVYHPGEDRCFLLTLKKNAMDHLDMPESLKELDVVVLSDLIIEHYLKLDHQQCEQENLVHYFSDPDEALDVAVKDSMDNGKSTPLLFLMNPTLVGQVKNIADQDLIMPHKSTYFYPKVITGLLFNQLVDEEKIERL